MARWLAHHRARPGRAVPPREPGAAARVRAPARGGRGLPPVAFHRPGVGRREGDRRVHQPLRRTAHGRALPRHRPRADARAEGPVPARPRSPARCSWSGARRTAMVYPKGAQRVIDAVPGARLELIERLRPLPAGRVPGSVRRAAARLPVASAGGRRLTAKIPLEHAAFRSTACVDSAANAWDLMVGGGVADLSRTPSSIIDEGPQRTVRRYRPPDRPRPLRHAPVLLVPPLAAPASCFDLRKGCSIAEHLLARGLPDLPRRLRRDLVRRPRPRARALGRRRDPEGGPGGVRGRRRPARAGRGLVPRRDHVAARGRRAPGAARSARSR